MSEYSIRSNMQSIFTDCPHREKLGWLADMIQSMGAIHSQLRRVGLPAQHAARHARVPAAGRADPGHRARVPDLRRRLPRRRQLGRRVHHHAVLPVADLRRHAHDARVLDVDAGLHGLRPQADQRQRPARQRPRRLDRGRHDDAQGGDRHLRALRDRRPDGEDGRRPGQGRRRRRLPGARRSHSAAAFNTAFFDPATKTYTTAARRGSQALDALPLAMGIVPADAKPRSSTTSIARINAYHPGGERPAHQRRRGLAAADLPGADERRPRRRAVERPAGAERAVATRTSSTRAARRSPSRGTSPARRTT